MKNELISATGTCIMWS